jgi:hypothetical protein
MTAMFDGNLRNLAAVLMLAGGLGLMSWALVDWASYSAFSMSLLWR